MDPVIAVQDSADLCSFVCSLAWMELFLAAGTILRKFELELYETNISDVLLAHDFFLPSPKLDSKGIRIKVVGLDA